MILWLASLVICGAFGKPLPKDGDLFPNIPPTPMEKLFQEDGAFWNSEAIQTLQRFIKYEESPKKTVAKNVVFLVGDGMGVSTVTATRIYQGQRDFEKSGEDHKLVYDDFPNVALVKTYNVDYQVADSAGTATALFSGIKTRLGSIGVDVKADSKVPDQKVYEESKVENIMTWAQRANKDTGIITTTRITHATPACTYAHIHDRDWECDTFVPNAFKPIVKDIAYQLIEEEPGKNFKVILGGGYLQLGHIATGASKCRTDALNLTRNWIERHKDARAAFVTDNEGLDGVEDVEYLLGLFAESHVPYELLRDTSPKGTPSLSQMTKKGLDILKKNSNGFVLMVEGGRIDHAHHDNYVRLALEESAEFERTIAMVVEETDSDTLIIVTADHSHSFTINGYPNRGNDILGYAINSDGGHNKPALTLTYANGPGFGYHHKPENLSVLGPWLDVSKDPNRLEQARYVHMATYHLDSETHGGEDVAAFATGPGSNLIRGVVEQSYLAHVVSYAACIGPGAAINSDCEKGVNSSNKPQAVTFVLISLLFSHKVLYNIYT